MGPYDDILNLERPDSTHPLMPRADRAKQFMPFASLRGFDDVIDDRGTLRDRRMDLSEDQQEVLDSRIRAVAAMLAEGRRPDITIRLFTPDPARPEGWGAYREITGRAEKLRPVEREIRIDGQWYPLDKTDRISIL